jgi:hypothetical protein
MNQKIVKFLSEGLLIPASSYTVFGNTVALCAGYAGIFELGKNYKSIKSYMQNNTTFNKSPFK